MNGLTAELCADLCAAFEKLTNPPPIMTELFVDAISVAVAGVAEPAPRLLRQRPPDSLGGSATAFGTQERLPLLAAVRANGAAMHALDYEPMWSPANHCVSPALPALLALAETRPDLHIDGRRLLRAFALAIEMQIRLRRASGQLAPRDLIFHPPGVVGPLGAALGSGLLLGLDDEKLVHAVGIAASRAGTILANVGSMTKCLHCGAASADGLEAALLAEAGFRADPDALAGPRGYLAAFFGETANEISLREDRPLAVIEPGPAFKFYPCQYGTHFVIEAVLDARGTIPPDATIRTARVICPPMPYVDRPIPATGLAGKFSFQYVAATALLDGNVTIESFSDQRRFAPDMEALLQYITIVPDESRTAEFDEMVVDVEIDTDRGYYNGRCAGPPGFWGRPRPAERLRAKAADCLKRAGLPIAMYDWLEGITKTDAEDLRMLIRTCGGAC